MNESRQENAVPISQTHRSWLLLGALLWLPLSGCGSSEPSKAEVARPDALAGTKDKSGGKTVAATPASLEKSHCTCEQCDADGRIAKSPIRLRKIW